MAAIEPGLCGSCRWAVDVPARNGAHYVRCARAESDPAFRRYPPLPVLACSGFEAHGDARREPTPLSLQAAQTPPAAPLEPGPPLFERIGGREGVAAIVDAFYDRVAADPELRAIFPANLGPGREKQKLFFEQWLGGEARYSERFGQPRLRRRHFPFVITEHAAGRWLHHFDATLRECGVAEPDAAEVMRGLTPLARHMVNAGEDVPREPLGEARLG